MKIRMLDFARLFALTLLLLPVSTTVAWAQVKSGPAFVPPPTTTTSTTTVSTFAGSGAIGATNGTGIAATFNSPRGICTDGLGNLYVADTPNNRIRKVTSAGAVTTLAGSGVPGAADGTGTAATFNQPSGVCADTAGNIYVADSSNNKIRKIVAATGVVTTLAGSGAIGAANGTGTAATFNAPRGLCVDGLGNLLVADSANHRIRKIVPSTGAVTTFVGSGAMGAVDGTGMAATFNQPSGMCRDASGNLYVADSGSHKIRRITATGVVTTFAGSGAQGATNSTGTASTFNNPSGVCVDASGNLYVADSGNYRIRKVVLATASVSNYAGSGIAGAADGGGATATFNAPQGVCADAGGNVYVADSSNNKTRKVTKIIAQ